MVDLVFVYLYFEYGDQTEDGNKNMINYFDPWYNYLQIFPL